MDQNCKYKIGINQIKFHVRSFKKYKEKMVNIMGQGVFVRRVAGYL